MRSMSDDAPRLDTLLAAACARFAAREALSGLSYRDFLDRASGVRETLEKANLTRNEPLHVRISNHPLDLVAFFGA